MRSRQERAFYLAQTLSYIRFMLDQLPSRRYRYFRLAALWLALLFTIGSGAAQAQNFFSDLFGGIFGGAPHRSSQRAAPNYRPPRQNIPERRTAPPSEAHFHALRQQKAPRRSAAQETPHHESKAPSEATFFVAVLGDTLSQNLSDGLEEAFEDTPQIGIVHKGKESSGLVRNDYYDWVKAAHDLAGGSQKIDVAVVFVGSNDRQPISDAGQSPEPLSARWRELYAARVDSIIQSFKEKKIPLVWVGLPVMKAEKFSADMAQINEIFRVRAAADGATFVDLWDKFADDRGQYSAYGPDISGQSVKLRNSDGVHFTGAGARKLALFVEGEIKRIFDLRGQVKQQEENQSPKSAEPHPASALLPASPPPPVVFPSPAGEPRPAAPTLPLDRPAIGPAQPLTGASAPVVDELAHRDKQRAVQSGSDSPERAVVQHIFVEGGSQPHRAGRADDLAWPEEQQGSSIGKQN